MSKNTSISLDEYFDNFIQRSLNTGRFKNASEVIRAALRLLEEEENKIVALRKGIDSGHDKKFDSDIHLKKLKENRRLNG